MESPSLQTIQVTFDFNQVCLADLEFYKEMLERLTWAFFYLWSANSVSLFWSPNLCFHYYLKYSKTMLWSEIVGYERTVIGEVVSIVDAKLFRKK